MEEHDKKNYAKLNRIRKLATSVMKEIKIAAGDDKINPEIEDLAKDFEHFRLDSFEKNNF